MRAKIDEIRDAIIGGASKDEYLVDVFALVREAANGHWATAFDVQLMGGLP